MCHPISDHLEDRIIEITLAKRGEKFGEYLDRYTILTHEYLHIFTDKQHTDYKGSYQLEFVTTEFFNDEVSNGRLGIKFKYGKFSEDLLTKDHKKYNNFRTELRKLAIQVDLTTRFEIIEKIGQGSFAGVYRARDRESLEYVALKKYNSSELEMETNYFDKQCIMQEIAMLRAVQQITTKLSKQGQTIDNLVNLYEVHEISNSIVLVMNLVEGGELFQIVKTNGPFTWLECTTIMRQCLKGLSHLAEINIAHRDIKPENLL
jgi:serine/threonine protein kinase